MARTKEGKTSIQVVISEEAFLKLKTHAEEASTSDQKVFISDIVRIALAEYFQRKGEKVDFNVDRGGYRGSQQSGQEKRKK